MQESLGKQELLDHSYYPAVLPMRDYTGQQNIGFFNPLYCAANLEAENPGISVKTSTSWSSALARKVFCCSTTLGEHLELGGSEISPGIQGELTWHNTPQHGTSAGFHRGGCTAEGRTGKPSQHRCTSLHLTGNPLQKSPTNTNLKRTMCFQEKKGLLRSCKMIIYFTDCFYRKKSCQGQNLLTWNDEMREEILLQLRETILWFRMGFSYYRFLSKNSQNLPTLKSCKFLITFANQF